VKNNPPSLIEPISLRVFAITGFCELGAGRLDAVYVAEARDGVLCPGGQVRSDFARKGLWPMLDQRRRARKKRIVPVWLRASR